MPKTGNNYTASAKQLETQARINELASKLKLSEVSMKTNYIQGSLKSQSQSYLVPEQFPEINYPIRFYCQCCETGMKTEGELRKHIVRDKHKQERDKRDYVSQLELENKHLKKQLLKYECASIDDFIKECDECDFVFVPKEHKVRETMTQMFAQQSPMCFHEFFFHYKMWCKSQGSKVPTKSQTRDEMEQWQLNSKWGLSITKHCKDSFHFRNGSYNNFRVNLKPKSIIKEYNSELDFTRPYNNVSSWIGED